MQRKSHDVVPRDYFYKYRRNKWLANDWFFAPVSLIECLSKYEAARPHSYRNNRFCHHRTPRHGKSQRVYAKLKPVAELKAGESLYLCTDEQLLYAKHHMDIFFIRFRCLFIIFCSIFIVSHTILMYGFCLFFD